MHWPRQGDGYASVLWLYLIVMSILNSRETGEKKFHGLYIIAEFHGFINIVRI